MSDTVEVKYDPISEEHYIEWDGFEKMGWSEGLATWALNRAAIIYRPGLSFPVTLDCLPYAVQGKAKALCCPCSHSPFPFDDTIMPKV